MFELQLIGILNNFWTILFFTVFKRNIVTSQKTDSEKRHHTGQLFFQSLGITIIYAFILDYPFYEYEFK